MDNFRLEAKFNRQDIIKAYYSYEDIFRSKIISTGSFRWRAKMLGFVPGLLFGYDTLSYNAKSIFGNLMLANRG